MTYFPTKTNLNNIIYFINNYDNIHILDKLQVYNASNVKLEFNWLLDSGALIFLTGLMLKYKRVNNGLKKPTIQTMENLLRTLRMYYDHYHFEYQDKINLENIEPANKEFKIKLFLFNHIIHVNYGGYQIQYDEYGNKVFGSLDSFFEERVGFTFSDSIEFSLNIHDFLWSVQEKNYSYISEAKKNIKNVADLFELPHFDNTIHPKLIEKAYNFTPEKIIKFNKFLDYLSIEFGEQYSSFEKPMDKNILFEKPLIRLNGSYYCPFIQLLFDQHIYFSNILRKEVFNNTKIGNRFRKLKSTYLEDKTAEFLGRIFPTENVHSKLHYFPIGTNEEDETDVVVQHGNYILIFEAKTGELSDPALRGAPKSLSDDFTKLVGKAYFQGKRTKNFILNEEPATFYDKNKKHVKLQIAKGSRTYDIIICNVTLYPLRIMAANINELKPLHLFPENEYPFYISLFDLDILTQFIPNGSLFIDYLIKRMRYKSKINFVFSEIMFLNTYLRKQAFEDIDEFSPKKYHDPFDSFFIFKGNRPELQIRDEVYQIVKAIEESSIFNKVDIIRQFLSLGQEKLTKYSNIIKQRTKSVQKDGSNQYFVIQLTSYILRIYFKSSSNTNVSNEDMSEDAPHKEKIGIDHIHDRGDYLTAYKID